MSSTRIDFEQRAASPALGTARRAPRWFGRMFIRPGARGMRRRSNLLAGAATVLEILPPPRRDRIDLERIMARSDEEAIAGDWQRVGQDLVTAARRRERRAR